MLSDTFYDSVMRELVFALGAALFVANVFALYRRRLDGQATGPLPVEQKVGLVSVENAAGQIGLLGVATGNEVQLDTVEAGTLSPINLEDLL